MQESVGMISWDTARLVVGRIVSISRQVGTCASNTVTQYKSNASSQWKVSGAGISSIGVRPKNVKTNISLKYVQKKV